MRTLVIDSHKGSSPDEQPQNLHWRNARTIADLLRADLLWSYPTCNDNIQSGYDKIVMVHGSQYSYVDKAWIEKSPDADLYYVTNEYNLGEPRMLWPIVKAGRKYTVIANHASDISKIVTKYTKDWKIVNLNALSYNPPLRGYKNVSVRFIDENDLFVEPKQGCVYYGSFRKGREKYFKKYLSGKRNPIKISTHSKNEEKFRAIGVEGPFIPRIQWPPKGFGLCSFAASLYMEDEVTHSSYNFLANRFYEALNHGTYPLFTIECMNTVDKSNYSVKYFLADPDKLDLNYWDMTIPQEWFDIAAGEKTEALNQIKAIINE